MREIFLQQYHRFFLFAPRQSHKARFLAVSALVLFFGAVAAFGVVPLAPDAALLPIQKIVEPLPDISLESKAGTLENQTQAFLREEPVRRGDTVASLLARLNVHDEAAQSFIRQDLSARALYQLRPGRLVQARVDNHGALLQLRYLYSPSASASDTPNQARALDITRHASQQFRAEDVVLTNERRIEFASGTIHSSLFGATDAANIPDSIAVQIAEIFSGDIDFYRDLRRGDQFRVVYEMFYQTGAIARPGRVLATEFTNHGKTHQAVWYQAPGQAGSYYSFDGNSLRRAFLRAPLEFSRISSGFGGRLHPIMQTWRQHQGVDYAAPSGTAVRSTGDGVIAFVGKKGGYGNAIIIKHQGSYSTLYGHLSGFAGKLSKGTRITQGQVIGYVGMTGWATGPHLHYEFRVNDSPKNPLTVQLPQALPISPHQLADFRATTASLGRHIALLNIVQQRS